jgi:hypothetical protein
MKKFICLLLSILFIVSCFGMLSACGGVDLDGNNGGGNTDIDGGNDDGGNDNTDDGNDDQTPDETPSLPQTVVLDKITYTLLANNTYSVTSTTNNTSNAQITIPEQVEGANVTEIGEDAFRGKKLQKITLPETVTKIGVSAFNGCSSLRVANLGKVKSIGNTAFKGSSLLSADLTSLTQLGKGAFGGTSIQSITIPNGIIQIPQDAFSGCSILNSVSLPESVTEIGNSAFKNCSALSSINLENVELVDYYAFQNCPSLKEVTLTKVIYIKDFAFASTGLTNVTIGNDCIQIYLDTFMSCSYLQTINLGSAHTKTWYIHLVFLDGSSATYEQSASYPIIWREKLKDPTECKNFLSLQNHLQESYIATNEWFNANPV